MPRVNSSAWQLYDKQGRPLATRAASIMGIVMRGQLHGAAHVWIWRKHEGKVEVLLQKRVKARIKWADKLDKSAGGHMLLGEKSYETALRKTKQELGITLKLEQLELAYIARCCSPVRVAENTEFIEHELQWVYLVELPNATSLVRTDAATLWKTVADVRQGIIANNVNQLYAPYGRAYYAMLLEMIDTLSSP